jgi:hypothetical protein
MQKLEPQKLVQSREKTQSVVFSGGESELTHPCIVGFHLLESCLKGIGQ